MAEQRTMRDILRGLKLALAGRSFDEVDRRRAEELVDEAVKLTPEAPV